MSDTHILVVDDDPMIRFLVQEYLKASGFQVETCAGGREALAKVSTDSPSLMILDLQMPEMNGVEVLEQLRAAPTTASIPVLMLSANASEAHTLSTVKADAYLEKPFAMQALLDAVKGTRRESPPS
jgi:DNA-binding response OmpR family regulator